MDDDKMTDDALSSLKLLRPSAPSVEAKKLALNAALLAFDAAQVKTVARKRRWFSGWRLGAGIGVPIGSAVAALVLLPLGTQLYTATSRHVDAVPPKTVQVASAIVGDKDQASLAAAPLDRTMRPVAEKPPEQVTDAVNRPAVPPMVAAEGQVPAATLGPAPVDASRKVRAKSSETTDAVAALVPIAQPNGAMAYAPTGDSFQKFDENSVKVTSDEPVSTFSIDVDTASYSYVRGLLQDGNLPQPDAVRVEEMINYFPYDYPAPTSIDTPFKASMAVIPTPWNAKTQLLEIGIKGYVPPPAERAPENLTFLIDTSGSMDEPNKLPLLKRAFGLLVDTLKPSDTVSIVTYAGSAGIALKPTKASNASAILNAIDALAAEGSTDGIDGIALAYRVNAEAKGDNTVNRVILATDGDFNVGIDTPDELKTYIKTQRGRGIFLSVLGFGRGNLDDALMQSLAQNGDGNASYIDNFQEARKVLVEEGNANLVTIARDVKIQVEFNPAQISEYRLIGYETRGLNREDFNNDAVDAGEIGAGHTVTALYEITPAGSGAERDDPPRYAPSAVPTTGNDELGFVKIRYKAPAAGSSKLISTPITNSLVVKELADASNDQRFAAAVAAFGQKLRGSDYGTMSWQAIEDLANGGKGPDVDGYRGEFVGLVKTAAALSPDQPGRGSVPSDDQPSATESSVPVDVN